MPPGDEQQLAVVDLGSNSFRLVVFTARDGWWKRTDEIYEAVRIGEGLAATGELGEAGMARAQAAMEVFAHFCRAAGLRPDQVDAVATSAIRDATNARTFLDRAEASSGLSDGVMLDIGGGSMQLVHVERRLARELDSWPLGAVRMTERFLADDRPAKPKQLRELRAFVAGALERAPWVRRSGSRIVGIGGTMRNLAAAAQREAEIAEFGVQGFVLTRDALDALVDELAALPPAERGKVPGIKPGRADIILGGALVARLALGLYDELAAAGVHPGDSNERELLWAAALLHDIGMTVDYDDHHKHSRYLVLNAGLPGFRQREVALIGQAVRYHRKGMPSLGPFARLATDGDEERLDRMATLLRLAEDLERSRDQLVRDARVAIC